MNEGISDRDGDLPVSVDRDPFGENIQNENVRRFWDRVERTAIKFGQKGYDQATALELAVLEASPL